MQMGESDIPCHKMLLQRCMYKICNNNNNNNNNSNNNKESGPATIRKPRGYHQFVSLQILVCLAATLQLLVFIWH